MNLLEQMPTTQDTTKAILAFLQQQLEADEPEPLLDILVGLARAFSVEAAGLGAMLTASGSGNVNHVTLAVAEASWGTPLPETLPWEKDATLLARIKDSGDVLETSTADGLRWLLAPVRQASASWLVWLTNRQPHDFGHADRSCLALASECLVKRFLDAREGERWLSTKRRLQLQEGLNRTAAVTRRLTHDFCNILTSISGFAELALLHMTGDTPARRYTSEVLESARQGAQWSQKLQIFSLDRQQRFLPASLVSLLADEQIRPDWHRDVALRIDLPPRLPGLAIEGESLRMALSAIFENARDAIVGHGIVSIRAREVELAAAECLELLGNPRPGRHVEVTISDTGSGIAPEVRERLFREMFFTTKGRRRGLGLAIVYGIMQSYRGGFRLEPAGDHPGTIIQLFLPVAQ